MTMASERKAGTSTAAIAVRFCSAASVSLVLGITGAVLCFVSIAWFAVEIWLRMCSNTHWHGWYICNEHPLNLFIPIFNTTFSQVVACE